MRTATLNLTGMNSEQCADTVQHALTSINGVADVIVSLLHNQAKVAYDENKTGLSQLQEALTSAGFESRTASSAPADSGSCCGGCCS